MSVSDDIPIGDLDNWRQVFAEDFPDDIAVGDFPAAVSARWGAYQDGWGDSTKHGTYYPSKVVSVQDGILTKNLHTETINGVVKHLVAAIYPRIPRHAYGRYAVRWRCDPDLDGYKMAWLLWPDSGERAEGEVDWPERDLPSDATMGFIHRKYVKGTPVDERPSQLWCRVEGDTTTWHTDVIEWSPDLIVFIRDGVEVMRSDQGIPNTAMHWVIQTETEMGGAPPPADAVNGKVQIMWVAAWHHDVTARGPVMPRQVGTIGAPATATGKVRLTVDGSPDLVQVKFMLNGGTEIGSSKVRPYQKLWDSTVAANGVHGVHVKASDAPRRWFNGPARTITVRNPLVLVAPKVATGIVTLGILDYPWMSQVQWNVDDRLIGSATTAPHTYRWDSRKVPNGEHTIFVKAASEQYGWADGPTLTITVAN